MLKDLLMQGLTIIIQLVVLFVMGALFNYLNKKIGNEKVKKYYDLAKKAVQAAEQYFGAGCGKDKKAWVLSYLKNKTKGKLSIIDIDLLIESAVHEMNLFLKNKGLEK
ncbi:phage holin [Caloramator sp. E03]|uniref:phage holin n=1 Tax=Caloramator sp. E03 TaxID=2576307 RepID=UPI0011103343|nr:phage holin [Caloramator sp. E03]QCX32439.1 phage holin [Caloramator sp. E03]